MSGLRMTSLSCNWNLRFNPGDKVDKLPLVDTVALFLLSALLLLQKSIKKMRKQAVCARIDPASLTCRDN